MSTLDRELDEQTRALLQTYGFDACVFEQLRGRLLSGHAEDSDNRLASPLALPQTSDLSVLSSLSPEARGALHMRGMEALTSGRVAIAVLAGGMATRFGGVVKASVRVAAGQSFLQLKLRDLALQATRARCCLDVGIMTSFATDQEIRASTTHASLGPLRVALFPQLISLRMTPAGALFRGAEGHLSPYATGHGDLVPALRRAGLLQRWRAAGVEHLFVSNVDNLAATLDAAVLGAHLARGASMSFEVSALREGDRGGVAARVDGRLQVIEALRYPKGFEERRFPWFSINSMYLRLDALDQEVPLAWFCVRKQVDGREAVQFERFLNQLTALVPAHALVVPRDGHESRFLPVKDPDELRRRLPDIEAVLRSRGVL